MSAVMRLSSAPLEGPPPRVICGWAPRTLSGRLLLAAGRIGLRRSATRAPDGRLHASPPGPLTRGPALSLFPPAGVGRQCAKLRGSGGGAPRADTRRHL